MCIPRICLAEPISFIDKDLLKTFFNVPILIWSRPTINMSCILSRRIRRSPSSNFFTNTLGQFACRGTLGLPWRIQTSGTIDGALALVPTDSSSTGIPGSPFPFWRILLIAAWSPLQDHHVGTPSLLGSEAVTTEVLTTILNWRTICLRVQA